MAKKIMGYIILGEHGQGYVTYRTSPRERSAERRELIWIVCMGQSTTVFPTRRIAQRALSLTIEYGRKKHFAWETWLKDARIQSLVHA
jgi:hypothetical protein